MARRFRGLHEVWQAQLLHQAKQHLAAAKKVSWSYRDRGIAAARAASRQAADACDRGRRTVHQLLAPYVARVPSSQALSDQQHQQIQKQLKDHIRSLNQMQLLKSTRKETAAVKGDDDGLGMASTRKMSKTLDNEAQKWRQAQKEPTSGYSYFFSTQMLSDTLSSVTDSVTKLPGFASYAVEATTKLIPGIMLTNGNESKAKATVSVKKSSNAAVSKTAIDARTLFLVEQLHETVTSHQVDLRSYVHWLELLCVHLHQYPWAKGMAVRANVIGEILLMRKRFADDNVALQTREALDLLGYHDAPSRKGIRILCLDGGGMRGLVALEVLEALERLTGKRICELFDFICGVSTGAIIAAFLSFHKKTVADVDAKYRYLGTEIFTQNVLKGATGLVKSHSFYDTQAYEKILQSFVGDTRMSDTVRTANTPKVALISTLVSGHKNRPYIFRNYHYPYRSQSYYPGSARHAIWAAVRASSAAPGYFEEFRLGDKLHHDGGVMTNNPTNLAIHEAMRLWPSERLQCVVSLGTGRTHQPLESISREEEEEEVDMQLQTVKNLKGLSLVQKGSNIVDSATDTEIMHCTLHDLLPGSVYFRFNPILSETFSMAETRPEKESIGYEICAQKFETNTVYNAQLQLWQMREDTQQYVRRNYSRFEEAVRKGQLEAPRSALASAKDSYDVAAEVAKAKLHNSILPWWFNERSKYSSV